MATVNVAHKPELTAEETVEVFASHFAGRYEIQPQFFPGSFVLRKSRWAALNISLIQRAASTSFRHTRKVPLYFYLLLVVVLMITSPLGALIVGVIGWILMRRNWKVMEDEVTSLLLSASEFKSEIPGELT